VDKLKIKVNKKLLFSFLFVFISCLVGKFVLSAIMAPASITVNSPVNGTVFLNQTFGLKITTNESVWHSMCNVSIIHPNGTNLKTPGVYFLNLTNTSTANTTFVNTSFYFKNETGIASNAWYRLNFTCINGTNATDNVTWYNDTVYFKLRDSAYSFILSAPNDKYILWNGTVFNQTPGINITLNVTAANCTFLNTTGTSETMQALLPDSTNMSFTNASATTFTEMKNKLWHNLTFYCYDAMNNRTMYNTSNSLIYFAVDLTNPTVTSLTSTVRNKSSGGNYLNGTFNVTDNHTSHCRIRVYQDARGGGLEILNLSASMSTFTEESNNFTCTYDINSSAGLKDGKIIVQAIGYDKAGRTGVSNANITKIVHNLKTGWNPITIYSNMTLVQLAGKVPNITYISVFNNSGSYKNYATFTTGLSTNANIRLNETNATYVYVSEDVMFMEDLNYTAGPWLNVTLYKNDTTAKSSWNLMGVVVANTTMNQTFYGDRDTCHWVNGTNMTWGCANITWISWFNVSDGKFYSAYRGQAAVSVPGRNVANLYIPQGSALWIAVNENITYNRTNYTSVWNGW